MLQLITEIISWTFVSQRPFCAKEKKILVGNHSSWNHLNRVSGKRTTPKGITILRNFSFAFFLRKESTHFVLFPFQTSRKNLLENHLGMLLRALSISSPNADKLALLTQSPEFSKRNPEVSQTSPDNHQPDGMIGLSIERGTKVGVAIAWLTVSMQAGAQWSVMWYSETGAGRKMAVMVGGASCWAENRSQDFAGLALSNGSWTTRGWKRGRVEKGRGWRRVVGERDERNQFTRTSANRPFNFSRLTSVAAAMSSRAPNEIILDIMRPRPTRGPTRSKTRFVSVWCLSRLVEFLVPRRWWWPTNAWPNDKCYQALLKLTTGWLWCLVLGRSVGRGLNSNVKRESGESYLTGEDFDVLFTGWDAQECVKTAIPLDEACDKYFFLKSLGGELKCKNTSRERVKNSTPSGSFLSFYGRVLSLNIEDFACKIPKFPAMNLNTKAAELLEEHENR